MGELRSKAGAGGIVGIVGRRSGWNPWSTILQRHRGSCAHSWSAKLQHLHCCQDYSMYLKAFVLSQCQRLSTWRLLTLFNVPSAAWQYRVLQKDFEVCTFLLCLVIRKLRGSHFWFLILCDLAAVYLTFAFCLNAKSVFGIFHFCFISIWLVLLWFCCLPLSPWRGFEQAKV